MRLRLCKKKWQISGVPPDWTEAFLPFVLAQQLHQVSPPLNNGDDGDDNNHNDQHIQDY